MLVGRKQLRFGKSQRPARGDSGVPLSLEGDDAQLALADDNRRTIPRPQLALDPKFDEVSPEVGEINEAALAGLAEDDPDHALAMLAKMRSATDQELAALAARIAARLVLDVARSGPVQARGIGRMITSTADRADGDIDLDASLDSLLRARANQELLDAADIRVRVWAQPATAIALLVDRSGSMSGRRLATAAVAAAACAQRAPADWSVLAFADRVIAVKSQDDGRRPAAVVDDLLRLRGQGTTDLGGALKAAGQQLQRSRAKRRVTVLMSDCRATTGADPVQAARSLDELLVLAPADDGDDADEFARRVGGRVAKIDGPSDIPGALLGLLTGPSR